MAKSKQRTKVNRTIENAKPVEIYEHKGSKRLNNPQVGLVNTKTEKPETLKKYSYDAHLDPTFDWSGKNERNVFELSTVSLHVHERIDPRLVIEAVKKSEKTIWEQMNLFNRPINKLSFIKEIEFYQHEKDWTNRLVAGDSMLVMNSLLEREGYGSKVQTIYFDPPYGIKYGSNFQPFINNREVRDGKDEDLATEPETIRAFRDTWELGIHSYLTYIRDRLLLMKNMLKDSGSIFIQISEENVHRVRVVAEEVFGSNNFVSLISFQKTGGQRTNLIASTHDYIIWFAKDVSKIKYRQLYLEKNDSDVANSYNMVQKVDGTRVRIDDNLRELSLKSPKEFRLFQLTSLTSQNPGSRYTVEFDGKKFFPSSNQWWKTDESRMQQLIRANRIMVSGNTLRYVRFLDDFPAYPITSVWTDTAGGVGGDKKYVVQTNLKVVERCILMSSDPGDIVFDPTLGSGTTPIAAEKFGRKWIACDTSRVALTIAKQRILTETYKYYKLKNSDEGVGSGFIYKQVPHITLKSIANQEVADAEDLYDQPECDTAKIRVTGPFTVEAVPAPVVKNLSSGDSGDKEENSINGRVDWIQELLKNGIRLKNKKFLKLSRLESLSGTRWLHAEGTTEESPAQRCVVSFGPDFAPLEQKQVERALQEAESLKPTPTVIVFAAFQFDPEAAKDIDAIVWGGVSVIKVQMNADLFTEDLKKKKTGNDSFWLVGQPDVKVEKVKQGEHKNKFKVIVNGFDYYNPKTGTVESGGSNQISMWMLDTDYDGRSMLPRQIFFPMSGAKDGWSKLAKTLNNEIDEDLIEAYRGTESLPFEIGENRKIAIKIIDDRGIESLLVQDIN